MKRLHLIIIATLLLIGCSEKYDESLGWTPTLTPRYLAVSPTTLTYTSSSESKTLEVKSTQTSWRFENAIDWVSISPTSGSTSASVAVNVSENKSGDDARVGVFYFKSNMSEWNYEAPVSITQSGTQPVITLSKNEVDFTGASNSETINVSANCSWTVTSESDWLSVTNTDNSITLKATSNETNDYRSTTIKVSHTGTRNTSESITVRQAPASITASTEALDFTNSASKVDITINSEASWTATTSSSWIEINPTTGTAGTSVMTVSIAENTSTNNRTGYVILTIGNKERIQIPIRQDGIFIKVDNTSLTFKAAGETLSISINSNTNWKFKNCPSWIQLSQSSGKGNVDVTITANDNPSTNQRSGEIIITQDGMDIGATLTITQKGKTLDVSPQSLSFGDTPSSSSINISADDSWEIKNDNNWISITPSSGKGNATITVSVTDNELEESRQGTISVSMLDKTIYVSISQTARVFSVDIDKADLIFPASGGDISFNITSNTNWTLSDYPSWLTLSKTSGKGNQEIKATASENPNVTERTGSITLGIDGKDENKTINVTQQGKTFDITPTTLTFTSVKGTQTVTVTTDGAWSASTKETWITLSPEEATGNSTLKISVSENMSVNERSGTVFVKMGDKTSTISVTQSSKSFGITPTSLSFTDKSGSQNVAIETDGTWEATTTDTWISLTPSSGSGTSELIVTVSENTTDSKRNGTVTITMGDKSLTVSVSQDGKYLTINNPLLSCTSKGGTIDITVSTNDTWTATVSEGASWISLSKDKGNGTADIEAIISDNASVNERSGSIVIEANHGQSVKISITQDARYLTVDTREVLFYAKGGTSETITVSTDGTFKIDCTDSWLSINQTDNTFTVTATENEGNDARVGKINISLTDLVEGAYSLTLTVTQLNNGGSFLLNSYDEDTNYDKNNKGTTTSLTISGFGPDKSYDSTTTSGTTLTISNYKSDSSWDSSISSNVTVTVTGYKTDNNLDSSTNSSGSITKNGYGSDSNWQ